MTCHICCLESSFYWKVARCKVKRPVNVVVVVRVYGCLPLGSGSEARVGIGRIPEILWR